MSVHPLFCVAAQSVHISVELATINPPDAASSDLYSGELIGADQRVDLANADCEISRDVIEGEETRLDTLPCFLGGSETGVAHTARLALMTIFTWLCRRLWLFEGLLATSSRREVISWMSLRRAG